MSNSSLTRCKKIRKRILDLSLKVEALHIGGSFSSTEIMDALFFSIMTNKEKDNFIMSKGHCSILHYVILEMQGKIKKKDLDRYSKSNSSFGVHPEIKNNGINASTGSLGHGLGMSLGVAVADKKKRTFVLMSDGELQEGSTWEAIINAPSLNLNNLVVIIDNNNLQSFEQTSKSHPNLYPIEKKFREFGWESHKCNGHDVKEIIKKINAHKKEKPLALIAKTIKGYPINFMMNQPIWHYRSPSKSEYENAIKQLQK